MKIDILDLNFLNKSNTIAAFLIQDENIKVLIETGPFSTIRRCERALNELGVEVEEIDAVLLTHIHFDHAGAAWYFAQKGAQIYVHPMGVKHLQDPHRLLLSAKRIYKDRMDLLWGRIEAIKPNNIEAIKHRQRIPLGRLTFIAHHTPGHAKHHIAWQIEDFLFTGDVAGVAIESEIVVPPCPPPDIQLEDWKSSIDLMRDLNPKALFLTHFGKHSQVSELLEKLEEELFKWADWIYMNGMNTNEQEKLVANFVKWTKGRLIEKGLSNSDIDRYMKANPPEMSVSGLQRYWTKTLAHN